MEHYPARHGTERIDIAYLSTQEYDGDESTTYPSRRGWTKNYLLGYQNFGNRSPKEVEEFLQTWLYFGFVIEVFGVVGITVNTTDFIRTDRIGQRYITTKILPDLIVKEYASS